MKNEKIKKNLTYFCTMSVIRYSFIYVHLWFDLYSYFPDLCNHKIKSSKFILHVKKKKQNNISCFVILVFFRGLNVYFWGIFVMIYCHKRRNKWMFYYHSLLSVYLVLTTALQFDVTWITQIFTQKLSRHSYIKNRQ